MKYIKLFEQHVEDWNKKLLDYSWDIISTLKN